MCRCLRFSSVFPCLTVLLGLGLLPLESDPAFAEGGPATGFALWLRAPVNSARAEVTSVAGTPEFAAGYRGDGFGIGLAAGWILFKAHDNSAYESDDVSGSAFQIGPEGWFDVWKSADGRTRANLAAGIAFGRGSVTDKDDYRYEDFTEIYEDTWSATLVGFHAGFGGDHYLSPQFALGAEAGFHGTAVSDPKHESSDGESDKPDVGVSANGLYGLIRVLFVFGN